MIPGLVECRCGHVQNHHGGSGCHVAGCLCRRFQSGVSAERHGETVREANRLISKARKQRDRYKDALYHIAYRAADPIPTALEALGDLPEQQK